jgi:hypothetical protein
MCLVVYIASSEPLLTTIWEPEQGVCFCDLPPEKSDVRKQFRYPHVYTVASSEGCGCGFLTHHKTGSELQSAIEERKILAKLLQNNVIPNQKLQLLISYDGYETKEIDTRWKMKVKDLENCDFNKGWDYHIILVDLDETTL